MEFKKIIDSITSVVFVGIAVLVDFTTAEAKMAFLNECFVTFRNKRGEELSGKAKDLLDEIAIEKEKSCTLEIIGDKLFSFLPKYEREHSREWRPDICIISKGKDAQEFQMFDDHGLYRKTALNE